MAIDTSIYQIPLNTPDPITGLQKVAALKAQQQQQLIGAEQLKGAQTENVMRQQAMADDAAARKLFAGVQSGGAMPGDAEILGTVGPQHGAVIVKALRDADKAKVDLQKTRSEVAEKEADYSGGLAAMVKDANYSPAAVQLAIKHAHSAGYEQEAQQLQQLLAPENQDKIPALMDALIAKSPAQQKLISDRMSAQARTDQAANTAKKTEAELPGLQAKSTQEQLVTAGMTNPDDAEAQVKAMTPDQRAQLKLRAEEIAKLNSPAELAYKASDAKAPQEMRDAAKEALKILERHAIASRPITMNTVLPPAGPNAQLTGEEYLKTLAPARAAQTKAVAEGRAVMPSAASRSQAAQQIRMDVFQYDPQYSDQRAQIRKSFTAGADGRNIGALNTATVHLDQFAEAAKAMGNGSFRPGNAIFNALVTEFGGSAPTNLAGLKTAVAGELATALKGNATDPEIADIKAAIQSKNSPQQLADYVRTQVHVLGAKLNTYKERYQQQVPGDTTWNPVMPSARSVYQKYGFDPTAGPGAPASGGASYSTTATGKGGHKIGTNDGGKTWFDVQTGKQI